MNFRLTQEQELLRDSARRYFAGEGSFEQRRQKAAAQSSDWAHLTDFGWLAMLVPEQQGGLGSSLEDIAIVCEEMGRGLATSAFVGGAVLPARIIGRCLSSPVSAALLSAIADGSVRIAAALHEPGRRYELLPQTRAIRMTNGAWRISGEKILVPGGARADRLIVSVVMADDKAEPAPPALFVLDARAAGVQRRVYTTIDGVESADFHLQDVMVLQQDLLCASDAALDILQVSLDEAIVCLCAETLGAMDRAIELTAAYLKMRKQFGQALAEFQALQHAVAELWIDANSARSILYRAIAALGAPAGERSKAVAGCFIKLMQAAKTVTGTAVHLHGGIGMTCEYPVGHYLRRVLVSERMFGDHEHHLARYLGVAQDRK